MRNANLSVWAVIARGICLTVKAIQRDIKLRDWMIDRFWLLTMSTRTILELTSASTRRKLRRDSLWIFIVSVIDVKFRGSSENLQLSLLMTLNLISHLSLTQMPLTSQFLQVLKQFENVKVFHWNVRQMAYRRCHRSSGYFKIKF